MKRSITRAGILLAFLAVATVAQAVGMPILTPEQLSLGGLVALGLGELDGTGLKELLQAQGEAFDQFKKANDARLQALEAKGYAPADVVGKVDTINAELSKLGKEIDAILKQANRPKPGSEKGLTNEQIEHKQALNAYLRKGESGEQLRTLERKAMSAQSDPDGGFLVDEVMETEIDRVAAAEVAMRRLANVVTIGGASYKKLVKTRGLAMVWAGESESPGEGQSPQYSEIEIPVIRGEVEPWVPNDLLDDAMYNLEADLASEAGIAFAEGEGNAFLHGTGAKAPRGLLSYTAVANASYAWGKVGYIASGASGDFAASTPADKLIDLQHALKQAYRPGAVWMMSDAVLAKVRQMKDGSGQYYLWAPDNTAGFGGRLLGSPVATSDYMPALAANSYSIAYGNYRRAYTIVDRRGIAVIVDKVTKKGTTKYNFSKRAGGGITNFEAVKLMKFAAS
jgi:HK97 family phage major capsid protein